MHANYDRSFIYNANQLTQMPFNATKDNSGHKISLADEGQLESANKSEPASNVENERDSNNPSETTDMLFEDPSHED